MSLQQNHNFTIKQYINKNLLVSLIIMIISLCWYQRALAWNSLGHAVVAYVAYDNLQPRVRNRLAYDLLTEQSKLNVVDAMMLAAVWPDTLKRQGIDTFNHWHWINIPNYTPDYRSHYPTRVSKTGFYHVVWAIEKAQYALHSPEIEPELRSLFLRFLLHFVGDIHQPLHCIERFSLAHPNGDRGGNLFAINTKKVKNLHQLWDQGIGKLILTHNTIKTRHRVARQVAIQLQKIYPKSKFRKQLTLSEPMQWAQQSYLVAEQVAYQLPEGTTPSVMYRQQAQLIAEQQLVLAGYRLAQLLNVLYG